MFFSLIEDSPSNDDTFRIFDCQFSHISMKNDNILFLVCHLSVVDFRWSMGLCDWFLSKNRISHWLKMTRDLEIPTETQYTYANHFITMS